MSDRASAASLLGLPEMRVNLDPGLNFQDGRLSELVRYWQDKRGNRPMPSRLDVVPAELTRFLGDIILVDIEQPLRLRYRLVGSNITATMQRDQTGRYFDEIYEPALCERVTESYRWVIAQLKPLRTFGAAFYPDKHFYNYETLLLPLSADGRQVNMVLGGLVFHLSKPA